MKSLLSALIALAILSTPLAQPQSASPAPDGISPSRPIPQGKAPGMTVKLVKDTPEEKVYAIVFVKGDEALSGLTDFAAKYKIGDAHFTWGPPFSQMKTPKFGHRRWPATAPRHLTMSSALPNPTMTIGISTSASIQDYSPVERSTARCAIASR